MTSAITPEVLQRAQDYHTLFTGDVGRRVLRDMAEAYGERTSYVPNDPYATAFREGERHVYLSILTLLALAADPTSVVVVEGALEEET